MTIYIASYILISIILLVIINLALKRSKNKRINTDRNAENESVAIKEERSKKEDFLTQKEEVVNEEANAEEAKAEEVDDEASYADELIRETLKESPISEPALEYVNEEAGKTEKTADKRGFSVSPDIANHRGKIIAAMMLGAFVAILNQTLLNVALPHIMNDLGITANTVQWLSTGYMLTNGIFIPITAFLIARLGTRKLFLSAIFAFTIGSVLCSISTTFSLLMIGRIIQAAGAGVIMPLLMTVFMTIFPPEKRGAAMGLMGVAMIFAPAVGPTLSGWLIGHYSWRLLFDIIIPFGIIDLILAFFWMKDVTKVTKPKFDTWGFIFSTIGFGFLLYGFSEAGNDGWSSATVVISLIVGIISIIAFVIREFSTDSPMLDLHVFKFDIFALTTVVSMVINMAMFAAMILLPIYLQNIRGFTALQSGLLMLPGAIIMGIMSPISGRLFDKMGARPLAVIGLIITVATTWQFSHLTMQTTYGHIMLLYVLRMFGMSFIMMTVMTEGMNQLPLHLTSHGTAASNTARTVAGSIGTAFLVTVMTTRASFHTANYGNVITSDNPYLAAKLSQLGQAIAHAGGLPDQAGQTLGAYIISGKVAQQATISGINDAFVVATGIAAIALILAFFIKRSRPATKK
ncbi:DHA2 family efflux MFS transporter permease subunit [Bacillus sp. FJAT-49736]|uniref:DHA2 family efflux MFS transporter permease subunit n=1 Tax=Bacillus sp. FJAT-49736 TaxID=2833582 RepID=UPI001BC99E2C|nr:DHA2 family efflux MFS transporter permease subunit [Bacillus sp. FJAT-49736]MBS4173623.1 DHA2 family efflux MFS transporter permease subunit [Bacillus sp. FJAT-49736]